MGPDSQVSRMVTEEIMSLLIDALQECGVDLLHHGPTLNQTKGWFQRAIRIAHHVETLADPTEIGIHELTELEQK